jgi:hypothetical protein
MSHASQLHLLSTFKWCVQLNLALVGLLNVSLALEDPFDNQGLDGIYVDEALFEAEQVHIFMWLLSLSRNMAILPLLSRPSDDS